MSLATHLGLTNPAFRNVHHIGHLSIPATQEPFFARQPNPHYQGIVYHAIKKICGLNTADRIVQSFLRSLWSPDALQHDLDKLNEPYHAVVKDEHYYAALNEMNRRFQPKQPLLPVHYVDLRAYPWNLSPNVGAPYNVSEEWTKYVRSKYSLGMALDSRLSKHNLWNEALFIDRAKIHMIKDGKRYDAYGHDFKYWNTAFARLHLIPSYKENKVRLVFGAPWLLLKAEAMFIWPIIASILSKGANSPMLWGFETITGGWYRLRNWFNQQAKTPLGTFFSFDWSGFDRRARHSIISDIHKVWRSWFDFTLGYWPTVTYPHTSADPSRLENLWNWMTNAVLRTPLLMPNGSLLAFQHSGIYSGYLQTQLLDSCYNMVMIFTILSRMGYDISKVVLKVQGDDSIGALLHGLAPGHKAQFLELFHYYAKLYFGAELNNKATELSDSLENMGVLKYRNRGGIPYRDPEELLAMLYYPERSQSLPSLMSRAIGIAYANCGSSVPVYLVCEDIFNHLKTIGTHPDPKGLPGGLTFTLSEVQTLREEIDLHTFPSFFETIRRLSNTERQLLDERHWPTRHFIGIPK